MNEEMMLVLVKKCMAVHEQKLTVYITLVFEDLAPQLEAQQNSSRMQLAFL